MQAVPAGLELHVHYGALSMQETMWLTGNIKPLSPEITTRVTGNESLHQRDAVFVKKREVI
jgi:hypothetical protein